MSVWLDKPVILNFVVFFSVQRKVFEADFTRLIQALEVKPESITLMEQLAIQLNTISVEKEDLEKQKTEAVTLCNRRIQAAIQLYSDGRLEREEYLRRVEYNEREIASWKARTTETEKLAMELTLCLRAVDAINRRWSVSSDEDRQGMVRHLIDYRAYDLINSKL